MGTLLKLNSCARATRSSQITLRTCCCCCCSSWRLPTHHREPDVEVCGEGPQHGDDLPGDWRPRAVHRLVQGLRSGRHERPSAQTPAHWSGELVLFSRSHVTIVTRKKTVLDRGSRSDRPRYHVTTPTRAGLRRCRRPRPLHAARLCTLACS